MKAINTKIHYILIFCVFTIIIIGNQIDLYAQSPEQILEEFRKYTMKDYDYKTIYYKQLELYDDESKEIISGFYEEMASSSYTSVDKLLEFTDALMRNASIPDVKNISSLLDFQESGCGVSDYERTSDDYGNRYVIRESILFDPEKFFNCVFDLAGTGDNMEEVAQALTLEFETLSQTYNFYRDGRYYQVTNFVKTSEGWKMSLTYEQKMMYGVDFEDEEVYNEEDDEYENNSYTLKDPRDGNTYKAVRIGNQIWMAENLRFKTDDSWVYEDRRELEKSYGRLYNWYDAMNPTDKNCRDICPPGWHIPSDAEWKTLEITLGMSQKEADGYIGRGDDEGKKMKSTNDWTNNVNVTNSSGFNALPGGQNINANYFGHGWVGKWWSASEKSAKEAWIRSLYIDDDRIYREHFTKKYGISVRCVYDFGSDVYNEEENYQEYEKENTTKDDEPMKFSVDLSINKAEISESIDSDLNDCFTALKIKLNYTAALLENSKFTQYPKSLKIPYIIYLRPVDQSSFETFYNSEAILRNGVPNSEITLTIGEPNFSIPDNNYEIFIEFLSPYDKSSIVRMQRNDFPFFRKVCFEKEKNDSEKASRNKESYREEEKANEPKINESEKYFQEAQISLSEKDFAVALNKFKKVYEGDSKSVLKKTALFSMAECSYQLKKYDAADEYLEEFKSRGFLDNDYDKRYSALKALSSFRKKKPDFMQGLSHAGSYDINLLPEIYQKDLLYFKAYALEKLNRTEQAVEAYEKYVDRYPKEKTGKFTKQLDELKYKLLIDKAQHVSYEDVYKRIDFKGEDQINKIIIYEIGSKLLLPINQNVNGVILPILIKNANVGDKYAIYIERLPIYKPVIVSRLQIEADIPRAKLHIKDFTINLSYKLLKKKTYSDFIYYDHNQSSFITAINPKKNKIEKTQTGQIFPIGYDSFSEYYLEINVEVEDLGRNLKNITEIGSKKESSDIYLILTISSSELNAIRIINDAKQKAQYIQLVGGMGIE